MKRRITHSIVQKIRKATPLSLRWKIGPPIAYFVYLINIYIRKNRPTPKVLSLDQTIDKINKEKLSVIRFGDGEMSLICGDSSLSQKQNHNLAIKLRSVLQKNIDGLLICIPGIFEKLNNFTRLGYRFYLHHLFRYGYMWNNLLSYEQIYGDTNVTRPYLGFKNKENSENIFKKLFSIWENKEVVLIEGEKTRLGVGNDIFNKVKSLERILCPAENAFLKYEEIKKEVEKVNKNKIILLSLGPTAKILAYDLFLLGYRIIDIGHIDMEYEMFLRKASEQIKVKYKYFSEIKERNPENYKDPEYLRQIIAHIR